MITTRVNGEVRQEGPISDMIFSLADVIAYASAAFTLLPGRRMHDVLFGVESGWVPSLVVMPLVLALTFYLWRRLMPRRSKVVATP